MNVNGLLQVMKPFHTHYTLQSSEKIAFRNMVARTHCADCGCNHSIFPIYIDGSAAAAAAAAAAFSIQAKLRPSRFHRQLAKQHEVHGLILYTRKSQASQVIKNPNKRLN